MGIDPTSEPSSPTNSSFEKVQWDFQNSYVDSEPVAPLTMPSSPPTARTVFLGSASIRPSDLKMDVPLLSSCPGASAMPNHFTETLVPETMGSDEILQYPVEQGEFFEEAFQAILDGRHHQTKRQLEEERLNPADALLRLAVPAIDFHIPDPEWNTQLSSPQAQFKWLQRKFPSILHLTRFGGLMRLEASLKWTPVPYGSGRISLAETAIQLGPISRELLILRLPRLCSRDFIAVRSQLMVLQVLVDEEIGPEVVSCEEVYPPAQQSLSTTLRSSNQPDKSLDMPSLYDLLKSRSRDTSRGSRRRIYDKPENLLPDACDPSAATSLLSSFIELRQPKRLKMACSSIQPSIQSIFLPRTSDTIRCSDTHDYVQNEYREPPAPNIVLPMETCRYVISLNLSRNILSHLEKLWQQVELIDRDFSQHNTVIWSPGSAQRKEVVSPLAFEADISLCPAAGLIITTILKVKQKPLPGSTTLTPLRERVKLVSEKYESLFILVSESNPLGEYVGSPTVSDIAGYADFVRFTSSLQAGISTYLVSGSDETISKWALSIMCRYSSSANKFGQVLDFHDSSWELFLRRVGLNISAAQVISGLLRSEYGGFGLAKFLIMDSEERLTKYGQIMGGQRILNNVSRILDQEWV
ncbi:hypothetical protein NW762_001802 [Fusarium torreyae]|uniref:Uncharacterized protein n=1 Tax=Fusarium torreyae TaxID=1237075 RepID=A0A9W8SE03_9HYPO|nr:hypothetical protein NW762_001802 [Fusarium torreyae]